MSFKEQSIEVESIETSVLIEELKSRDELPMSDIDEFSDSEIEDEYTKRNPKTASVIDIAEYINHRISLGLDYQDNIQELLECIKSL